MQGMGMLDLLLASTMFGRGAPMGIPGVPPGAQPEPGMPAVSAQNPGIPAGMLASLMMKTPGGFDQPQGAPGQVVPSGFDTMELPRRDPQWGEGAAAVPHIDAVAGMLSGNRPSTNDPMSGEPQPDVPLPRPRPDDLGGSDAMAAAPSAPLSLSPGDYADKMPPSRTEAREAMAAEPGFLEGIGKKLLDPNKAATLMALGSGFAGAGSIGTGMRRAFGNAVPALAADRAQIMKQSTISDTYKALVQKGVPASEALAASQNPDIMKAVASKYFESKPRVPHEIGTDWLGNKIMGSFDPNTGKFYDAAGDLIKPKGAAAGMVGGGTAAGGMNMLAKGVTEYNPELGAEEYLGQFGPEVQSAIKSYARGDTQPTGNPRLKGFETKVKEWARLWGDKAGVPVSDAMFTERRKYRNELGSTSANTAGGQAKAFDQGMEHAASLAKKLEELKNVDPLGIPSVAHGINWMRQAFSSKQTGIAKEAAGIGQTLAGEVGKLFSGQAGGGVHERELTRQRFNTITTPHELAGALEATVTTMEGGLHALESRRDQVLGPGSDVKFVTKEAQDRIAKIREVIARLKGEAGPAPAAAPGRLEPGASTTINGVTIKRLN